MQLLHEQYLFICKNEVSSIADLIRLKIEANQTLEDTGNRQKEIYKERSIRKRQCKTVEDFKKYQIWNLESGNELDGLKVKKKQAKSDIRMINACMSENLYTAFGYVDEMEELNYGAEDVLPVMYDYQKRDIAEEFGIVGNTDRVIVDELGIEKSLNDMPKDCFVAEAVSADGEPAQPRPGSRRSGCGETALRTRQRICVSRTCARLGSHHRDILEDIPSAR